jgi:hypothetical protein
MKDNLAAAATYLATGFFIEQAERIPSTSLTEGTCPSDLSFFRLLGHRNASISDLCQGPVKGFKTMEPLLLPVGSLSPRVPGLGC